MTGTALTEATPTNDAKPAAKPKAPRGKAGQPKHTKKAKLIKLLGSKRGADLAALSETFGWQPHTTRAMLSGLRKAGYEIELEKAGGGKPARYRLTGSPAEGG